MTEVSVERGLTEKKLSAAGEYPQMAAVRYEIDQILLAIANASKAEKQDILSLCAKTGCGG